jgi:hypothetical protein
MRILVTGTVPLEWLIPDNKIAAIRTLSLLSFPFFGCERETLWTSVHSVLQRRPNGLALARHAVIRAATRPTVAGTRQTAGDFRHFFRGKLAGGATGQNPLGFSFLAGFAGTLDQGVIMAFHGISPVFEINLREPTQYNPFPKTFGHW